MSIKLKTPKRVGFCSLLTIVFVIFKLLGKITWSWWWVFAPLWILATIYGVILIIIGIGIVFIYIIEKR